MAQSEISQNIHNFNIAAQALDEALMDFGTQSGLQISIDAAQLQGRKSSAVSGRMSAREALSRLLGASGFTYSIEGNVVTLARAPQAIADTAINLGPLKVGADGLAASTETGAQRDARRKDAVYDQDLSSIFASREEVERYRGTNTADVLKGMVNVFSGDARNGGALDPSIRGIQGPGRVPVIIDGTEQALTVWRGYNGASNRSYIDPSLISGMQVLKGPGSTRGVNGSTGGAVVINTLDAADILAPDQTFGLELKVEGGNNSTNPRLPTLLIGQNYRNVPGFLCSPTGSPIYPYCDASLRVNLRTSQDNEAFSAGDRAIRLAAAGRIGDFELFGAYAFRERGNYFAGKHAADYYQQEGLPQNSSTYVRILGLHYEPGNEVPNTSSEMESVMLKAGWNIADDQALQIGFRDSRSKFGEIMPSRIMTTDGTNFGNVQWPLSKVHAQAWNAEYKWQPDSRWIDLKATAWLTDTVSDTYSAGGFPNSASSADPIIINSALMNGRNDRFGFSASNQFNLSSSFSFLLEGNWQHEKLRSDDEYSPAMANGWRQYPRAGRREEYRINLSGEWKPAKFIKFNAGLAYAGYWAKDDFLPRLIEYEGGSVNQLVPTSYTTSYQTAETGIDAYTVYRRAQLVALVDDGSTPPELVNMFVERLLARDVAAYQANPVPFNVTHSGTWNPDASGDYSRADNVCLNGSATGLANYVADSCIVRAVRTPVSITEAQRKSGHGWMPSASATVYLSDSSRAYLRYAQALRFPSMFESTIGFSASVNPLQNLKPERMKSWEAAFIQDLRPLFGLNGEGQHADVKLTWYHNTTRNVIERDTHLLFSNLDKQVIAGFELQARYDNGRFFADVSAGHMTTNKACDESLAATMDPFLGRVPNCVKYGFVASFLLTQATPETNVNLSMGGRFFDKRLEVGGRLIWYSAYDNPQLEQFTDWTSDTGCAGACALNIPFTWGEIVTLDAYARFRINDRFTAELAGTNLNDRYYMDPLSRSMLPAPGRTVRFSLTGRF